MNNRAPCDIRWFQAELDRICRDKGVKMRITWAPDQAVARLVEDGRTLEYAKYPLLFGEFVDYQKGQWYRRKIGDKWRTIAYQKAGDLIPAGVTVSDLAVPDIVRVNPSADIWVIERKLPDQYARKVHFEKTQLARESLGVDDLFGGFPEEGYWDWFDDVSEKRDGCCEMAKRAGAAFCYHLYREPNANDLWRVRMAVKKWQDTIAGRADKRSLQAQAARDMVAADKEQTSKALDELLYGARGEDRLMRMGLEKTRVYMDLRKVKGLEDGNAN